MMFFFSIGTGHNKDSFILIPIAIGNRIPLELVIVYCLSKRMGCFVPQHDVLLWLGLLFIKFPQHDDLLFDWDWSSIRLRHPEERRIPLELVIVYCLSKRMGCFVPQHDVLLFGGDVDDCFTLAYGMLRASA